MKTIQYKKDSLKWKYRYIDIAKMIAGWSKDPSTHVGVVAIGNYGQVIGQGYNGFPRDIIDTQFDLHTREEKYNRTLHAEENLLINCNLSGAKLEGSTVYVYGLFPCIRCALMLIQLRIEEVVFYPGPSDNLEQWAKDWEFTQGLMREGGIILYLMERKNDG